MAHFRNSILAVTVGLCSAGALSGMALIAGLSSHSDMVVRIDAAKGLALIRDAHTGRVMAFKATPADLGAMKVGDEVKANWKTGTLVDIKGVAKTATLQEPDSLDSCCNVVAVVKDRATMQALLGSIFAEPVNKPNVNPAEPVSRPNVNPAEPITGLRSKIKSVDAVNGIQADFGNELNGAEPVSGLILARNNLTGALHALNASVLADDEMGQTSAPITSSVKIGDPVSIDATTGIAMLKAQGGTYAFNLRGIKKTAEPVNAAKGPWVVEPDPKAEGRFGIVRTNWHEKTSSAFQAIYVYLPGKRDRDEYHEFFKTEHSVMVGEYDVKVNGRMLENVPVKAGHATRILLGALRSTAKFENQLAIYDTKDRLVMKIQGGNVIALPIGIYDLKVGTRTVKVEIKENQVSDF